MSDFKKGDLVASLAISRDCLYRVETSHTFNKHRAATPICSPGSTRGLVESYLINELEYVSCKKCKQSFEYANHLIEREVND